MISFTVPGQPQGKGRPIAGLKFAAGGKKIAGLRTPEKTVAYEGLVAHAAHQAMDGGALIDQAVHVFMTITCQVPASWSKKKQAAALLQQIRPTTKPDIDNVEKAIFDGCNGVVWRDDVCVVSVIKEKRYGATPGVFVKIAPAEVAA